MYGIFTYIYYKNQPTCRYLNIPHMDPQGNAWKYTFSTGYQGGFLFFLVPGTPKPRNQWRSNKVGGPLQIR